MRVYWSSGNKNTFHQSQSRGFLKIDLMENAFWLIITLINRPRVFFVEFNPHSIQVNIFSEIGDLNNQQPFGKGKGRMVIAVEETEKWRTKEQLPR